MNGAILVLIPCFIIQSLIAIGLAQSWAEQSRRLMHFERCYYHGEPAACEWLEVEK